MSDERAAALMEDWALTPDGAPFATALSRLWPVRHAGRPAMLKLGHAEEMGAGGDLLDWWDGGGAVRLIARAPDALLMQRAGDARAAPAADDLVTLSAGGRDAEAVSVLCAVALRLHARRPRPAPASLVPLAQRYAVLAAVGHPAAGRLSRLLANADLAVPLHGDLHHGNILRDGKGWLVIDPKGTIGERAADFAQFLVNPDMADTGLRIARDGARTAARLDALAVQAGLDRQRLADWVHVNAAALLVEESGGPAAEIASAVMAATA